tara:strand:- start:1876 stop:2208 length:333 start_codon:yes stop_codon:yes gene_type:complete
MKKSDFALYEKNGKIYSMGFEFNNLLKEQGLPAMVGGGNKNKNLNSIGLPVGIILMKNNIDKEEMKQYGGGVIDNSLYNKLLHLAEQRKTTNSNTRKLRSKRRNKTRKLK